MRLLALLSSALVLGLQTLPAETELQQIPFKTMDGKETTLGAYAGKVLLIVNVASKCGNTKQYDALEQLQTYYAPKGFTVLGFPCNDFGNQEPGMNEEIVQFCKANYKVDFPLFDKLHVRGPDQAPLYAALTGPSSPVPGPVSWNFGKFLVDREGKIVARFEPKTQPYDPMVLRAIEMAIKNQ